MFAETRHPVYLAAHAAQQKINERKMAEAKRLQDEQSAKAAQIVLDLLTASARAKQMHAEDLKARGLCPACEGKGKITTTSNNTCLRCGGTGTTTFFEKGVNLCPACAGRGTIGVARTDVRECTACNGSGKYPIPEAK
jgi:DnaJ-class molecular chaperone